MADQNVLRLDIAVDKVVLMQVVHRGRELRQPDPLLFFRNLFESDRGDELKEVTLLAVLHDQVVRLSLLERPVQLAAVRVKHRLHDIRLDFARVLVHSLL